MPDPIAAWRATYTPGNWVVLAGPTSMVVLQPAPARVSDLLNRFWGDVLQSRSIHEISAQIARHNLSQLASFGLLFWDEAGLHALTRGALRIVNPDTGERLASGESAITWTETALGRDGSIRIEMEPVPPDVLHLPLLVGAVTASSVFLTTHPNFLVRSVQNLVVPDQDLDFSGTSGQPEAPVQIPSAVVATPVVQPEAAVPVIAAVPVPPIAPVPVPPVAGVPLFGGGRMNPDGDSGLRSIDQVAVPRDNIVDADRMAPEEVPAAPTSEPIDIEPQDDQAGFIQGIKPVEDQPAIDELGDFSFAPFEQARPEVSHEDFSFAPVESVASSASPEPGFGATAPMSFSIGQQSGLISAVVCAEGHPNPVGSQVCRQCQGPVGQIPRLVPRPVVAVVKSNFGVSLDLSSPIFIGRAPDTMGDPSAQVIKVPSPSTDISRSHLRVAPNDWQVEITDLNSTNGSTITMPGQPPTRLEPGIPMSIPLGTSVDLGDGVQISIELPN